MESIWILHLFLTILGCVICYYHNLKMYIQMDIGYQKDPSKTLAEISIAESVNSLSIKCAEGVFTFCVLPIPLHWIGLIQDRDNTTVIEPGHFSQLLINILTGRMLKIKTHMVCNLLSYF